MSMPSFNWDRCKKYVINLDRREDRAKQVFLQFANRGINVFRWKATDWQDIVVPELSVKRNEKKAAGILACATSHIELIKYAKKYKFPAVAIFEDDCVLSENFNELVKQVESVEWGLCYLGGHFAQDKIGQIAGTYAYILKDTVYDYILRNWYYRWGWDEYMADVIQKKFNTFVCQPFIVGHLDGYSDISRHEVKYNIDPV